MIRVLIVDDHPVVHDGMIAVLHRAPDIRVVASAEHVADALAQIDRAAPDIILLDIRLPGEDGLSAIETLRARRPAAGIIMFSAYDFDEYVFGAIRAGARGYLLKGTAGAELIAAIRTVHAGQSYLSPSLSAKLVDEVQRAGHGSRLLTKRELAVLRLIAAGLSNKQIAESLSITERTVKFHVTAILNKLGADNRAQAVAMASRRGILPDMLDRLH
jgi:DNA-binding NarL/FixJ family response regulator